ncbi:DUF3828 domain-containing protein [bacterium]|nr:DUF3828 domain-containing protein [bacterium]
MKKQALVFFVLCLLLAGGAYYLGWQRAKVGGQKREEPTQQRSFLPPFFSQKGTSLSQEIEGNTEKSLNLCQGIPDPVTVVKVFYVWHQTASWDLLRANSRADELELSGCVEKSFVKELREWEENSNHYYKCLEKLGPDQSEVCAQRYLKGKSALNFDPIVCAQTTPETFSVRLKKQEGNKAEVEVREDFGRSVASVLVELQKEGNQWLITKITCPSSE